MSEYDMNFGGSLDWDGGSYDPIIDWGSMDTVFDYSFASDSGPTFDFSDSVNFDFGSDTSSTMQLFQPVSTDNMYASVLGGSMWDTGEPGDPAIAGYLGVGEIPTTQDQMTEPGIVAVPGTQASEPPPPPPPTDNTVGDNIVPPPKGMKEASRKISDDGKVEQTFVDDKTDYSDAKFYLGVAGMLYMFWQQDQQQRQAERQYEEMLQRQQEQFQSQQELEQAKIASALEIQRLKGEQAVDLKLAGRGGAVTRGEYTDYE